MKRVILLAACALLLLSGMAFGQKVVKVDRPTDIPSFIGYVPDAFIVVFKSNLRTITPQRSAADGVIEIGEPAFDAISHRFAVADIHKQFPGTSDEPLSKTRELARYHKVKINAGTLDEAMAAYADHPMVDHVEPIGIHAMYATPNDGYYSYQWHLNQANDHDIDAPEAWNIETGSTSVVVAILDSGTRYYHPDLGGINASSSNPGASRGNMWINNAELNGTTGVDDDANGYVDDWIGYDFVVSTTSCWSGEDCNTADNDPRDFNGHGTHTAGIFGMITNDNYGMAGVAGGWSNGTQGVYGNGVKIMPLRMGYSYNYLGQEYGVVLMDAAAQAFYYAANNGAQIASCSWGSSNSGGIAAAATYFINNGGLIFVAAGNDGAEVAPSYLSSRGDCIDVGATDENDNGASFTTYGTWVDISAPGNNIYSTYHDHTDPTVNYWAALGGTSMATPMVAGVGALIWSKNPTWTAAQVKDQLYASADNIDAYLSAKYIGKMGVGRINAYNAVNTGAPCDLVANFSGTPVTGCAPLNVSFTNLSTGTGIDGWAWTFGDGGTSTAQNPSHSYAAAGTYSVSLTVSSSSQGCNATTTKTGYITVQAVPVAQFVGTPTSGTAPLTVNFTNQSTGGATSWSWNFGDGGTATTQNPSHVYSTAGTYTVTLTASNACGSDGETKTGYITVTAPPAYTVITFDNFETGMGTYTDGGGDMTRTRSTTYAHQGSYSAGIQDNSGTASSFYTTTVRNVSAYTNMEVTFWFKAVSMETGEDFWLQYYNGTTWQTVATFRAGTEFTNNVFTQKTVSIPKSTYTYPTGARIRFMCDASDNNDDVYIDEIEWRGYNAAAKVATLPEGFALNQNYPNPFNPTTTISFTLPAAGEVRLEVFNVLGQQVAVLADGQYGAGTHHVTWDASGVSTGVYLYRLQAGEFRETKKMLLVK